MQIKKKLASWWRMRECLSNQQHGYVSKLFHTSTSNRIFPNYKNRNLRLQNIAPFEFYLQSKAPWGAKPKRIFLRTRTIHNIEASFELGRCVLQWKKFKDGAKVFSTKQNNMNCSCFLRNWKVSMPSLLHKLRLHKCTLRIARIYLTKQTINFPLQRLILA